MKLSHYQRNLVIVAVCVVIGMVWTLATNENVITGILIGVVGGGTAAFVWDMLAKKAAGHLDHITPYGEEEEPVTPESHSSQRTEHDPN